MLYDVYKLYWIWFNRRMESIHSTSLLSMCLCILTPFRYFNFFPFFRSGHGGWCDCSQSNPNQVQIFTCFYITFIRSTHTQYLSLFFPSQFLPPLLAFSLSLSSNNCHVFNNIYLFNVICSCTNICVSKSFSNKM